MICSLVKFFVYCVINQIVDRASAAQTLSLYKNESALVVIESEKCRKVR